jgi:hypothetical protein
VADPLVLPPQPSVISIRWFLSLAGEWGSLLSLRALGQPLTFAPAGGAFVFGISMTCPGSQTLESYAWQVLARDFLVQSDHEYSRHPELACADVSVVRLRM